LYKYEYYEETSNEENKTEVFIDNSNYTDNDTNSTIFRKDSLTRKVQAIRLSWLDILLFIWIITFIINEMQQVKFELHIDVHPIYFY
jgi:hypothetical protein